MKKVYIKDGQVIDLTKCKKAYMTEDGQVFENLAEARDWEKELQEVLKEEHKVMKDTIPVKNIKIKERMTCPNCYGKGYTEHIETLHGADRGMYINMDENGRYTLPCERCKGKGYLEKKWV